MRRRLQYNGHCAFETVLENRLNIFFACALYLPGDSEAPADNIYIRHNAENALYPNIDKTGTCVPTAGDTDRDLGIRGGDLALGTKNRNQT